MGNIFSGEMPSEKTIVFKVLDFLMELYKETENISAKGKFAITELRNKHHLSPEIVKVLQLQKIILQTNPGERSPQYKWNSIRPTIYMAREVAEDARKEREKKTMITVHSPKAEESPVAVVAPPVEIHVPMEIDYNEIERRFKTAMPELPPVDMTPVLNHFKKEMQTACDKMHLNTCKVVVAWLQQNLGGLIENELTRLQPGIQYVDKITEHHHYVDKDEKKGLLQRFGLK